MNSTFCNFELKDGNFVIDKFTVCTPITPSNNKLGGVHRDGCSVGTNGKQSVDRQYTLEGEKKKSHLKYRHFLFEHFKPHLPNQKPHHPLGSSRQM